MIKKPHGFTLLEATLSLAVLTVGMLGLAGAFSEVVKSDAIVKQKQITTFLAAAKISQLRTTPVVELGELQGAFAEPFQEYQWSAQFHSSASNNRIAELWLEVKHNSGTTTKLWTQITIRND